MVERFFTFKVGKNNLKKAVPVSKIKNISEVNSPVEAPWANSCIWVFEEDTARYSIGAFSTELFDDLIQRINSL